MLQVSFWFDKNTANELTAIFLKNAASGQPLLELAAYVIYSLAAFFEECERAELVVE